MCLATFFFLFHRNNFKFLNLSLKFPAFVLQHQRTHSAPNPFIKPCPRRSLLITRFQRPLHTCSPPRGTCASESPSSPQAAGARTTASASSVKPAFSVTYHFSRLCHAGQGCVRSFCWRFMEETYHQTLPLRFSCSTKAIWMFLPPAASSRSYPEREENAGSRNMMSFSLLHRVP